MEAAIERLTKRKAQKLLNDFYQAQFKSSKQGFFYLFSLLRLWFGWFQDSRIVKLQKYLNSLPDDATLEFSQLQAIKQTSRSSNPNNLIDDLLRNFFTQLDSSSSPSIEDVKNMATQISKELQEREEHKARLELLYRVHPYLRPHEDVERDMHAKRASAHLDLAANPAENEGDDLANKPQSRT